MVAPGVNVSVGFHVSVLLPVPPACANAVVEALIATASVERVWPSVNVPLPVFPVDTPDQYVTRVAAIVLTPPPPAVMKAELITDAVQGAVNPFRSSVTVIVPSCPLVEVPDTPPLIDAVGGTVMLKTPAAMVKVTVVSPGDAAAGAAPSAIARVVTVPMMRNLAAFTTPT